MLLGSKDTTRIVPHFMLPQFCKTFGIREAPAPLLPHVLAGPKVIHPRSCKHDVVSDFFTLVSKYIIYRSETVQCTGVILDLSQPIKLHVILCHFLR